MKTGTMALRRLLAAGNRPPRLVESSPLRALDVRLKLVLMLLLSPAVTLPLPRLAWLAVGLAALLTFGRLWGAALAQARRMAWLLLVLLVVDWVFISGVFAITICLRFLLLMTFSVLLLATTTPREFREGLRGLGLPYRYAFALGLSFDALDLLRAEWRNIREAQFARGALVQPTSWRQWRAIAQDAVALAVPAVVLTTRRAWALTEAAHARGLDSPYKPAVAPLRANWRQWAAMGGAVAAVALLALYP